MYGDGYVFLAAFTMVVIYQVETVFHPFYKRNHAPQGDNYGAIGESFDLNCISHKCCVLGWKSYSNTLILQEKKRETRVVPLKS